VTAPPVPCADIAAQRAKSAAELPAFAAGLTEHGLRLALGTLISYSDPVVRRAVIYALAGAEAGQGPDCPEVTVWFQGPESGDWCPVSYSAAKRGWPADEGAAYAKYAARKAAGKGLDARYLVLPAGSVPDGCWECGCGFAVAGARPEDGLCGACRIAGAAEDAGLYDLPGGAA